MATRNLPTDAPPRTAADFFWPAPPGAEESPVWTGNGFRVGSATTGVLSFATSASGWTDDLTAFHEDTAGSSHPIDSASRAIAMAQLARLRTSGPVILEVGCLSGLFLHSVRTRFPNSLVIGADYVKAPLEALSAKAPDIPLLQFDLRTCPLPDASVDAVVLLNVLEHIQEDEVAMRHVARILRPGGLAIVEVPAGPELFDVYDELLMHYRRYRMRDLRALLGGCGLEVVHASHLGALIYPPFYLVKQWNKRHMSRGRAAKQQVVSGNVRSTGSSQLLDAVLRLELLVGKAIDWPFGIRCIVTGRKPLHA